MKKKMVYVKKAGALVLALSLGVAGAAFSPAAVAAAEEEFLIIEEIPEETSEEVSEEAAFTQTVPEDPAADVFVIPEEEAETALAEEAQLANTEEIFSIQGEVNISEDKEGSGDDEALSAAVKNGWVTSGNKKYYYKNGKKLKGWQTIKNKRYYFTKTNGVMKTGWVKINKKWYYFNKKTGAMRKGWLKLDGKWYYLNKETGVMETAKALKIGDKAYYFDADGVRTNTAVINTKKKPKGALSVTDYGAKANDKKDDTAAFNAAINALADSNTDTVYVPAGTYRLSPTGFGNAVIEVKSGMKLYMHPDAKLQLQATAADNYSIIAVHSKSNVTIAGGQIIGDKNTHKGTEGESGMGINIIDSHNIVINNVKISKCWGDGIYMGTADDYDKIYGSSNIVIANCTINENRRNNVTFTDADYVVIDNCTIKNAGDRYPYSGIVIEPNTIKDDGTLEKHAICEHIAIINTKVDQTRTADKWGFAFVTSDRSATQPKYNNTAKDVWICNCVFKGKSANYTGKNFHVSDSQIEGGLL